MDLLLAHGYFLGGFRYLERESPQLDQQGRARLAERLGEIAALCSEHSAQLALLLVPAPVQVCDRSDLLYLPPALDLNDAARFDFDKPQRMLSEIAASLNLPLLDLRPTLRNLPDCPYQPRNLHWTAAGHDAVAAEVAGQIREQGWLAAEDGR